MISGPGLPPGALAQLRANAPVQNQANTDSTQAANNGTSGAFYTELDFSTPSASALGIRVPADDGDAEALLAEVSLLLEKTSGQSRSDRDTALAHGLQGAFLSIFQSAAALQQQAQKTQAAATTLAGAEAQLASDQIQLSTDLQTLTAAQTAYDAAVKSGDQNKITQAQANLQQAESNVAKDSVAIGKDSTNITKDAAALTTDIAGYQGLVQAFQTLIAPAAARVAASIAQQQPAAVVNDHGHDLNQRNEFDKIFIDILQKFTSQAQIEKADLARQSQFADQAALANIGRAAVGLIAGLGDALTALQQLQGGFVASSADNSSLSTGSRVKIPV
jgi:hypothetical protein